MVRNYAGQVYSGGKWDPSQRAYDKSQFELTPILKLYKQAVQKGEKAFNVISDLTVIGNVTGDVYKLNAIFTATNSVRTIQQTFASKRGNLFDPIRASVTYPLGDMDPNSMNCIQNLNIFKQLYLELFQELTSKILEVNPDSVLEKLLIEPGDVTNLD
jgi:hypothetical protein